MMNFRILLIGIFVWTQFNVNGQNDKFIKLPEISKELITMSEQDQKYRNKWSKLVNMGKTDSKKFKRISKKLREIDRHNTNRIRVIVEQYGWPTFDLVGKKASKCAWIIVQHADMNPLVQIKCLPLLKAAVDMEQADPSNYAYILIEYK